MYAHSMEEEKVDGYQLLAEAIIEKYAPLRRTIIRKLCNSAVKSVVEYEICYEAFEKRRRTNMIEQGVYWQ